MSKLWLHLKNKQTLVLFIVLLLAVSLRFYKLGEVPHGFYWDEAAITYNAWGLAVWNRDEFGNKLPISFKSFGDYKAPLVIYMLGGIYKLTELHPEYLRVLIGLFGIVNVILMYYLAKELRVNPVIAALLMAITPWAIQFSRFGVEATASLTFVLLGILTLQYSLKKPWLYSVAALTFVLSMYTYHSAKIFVPLYVFAWAIFNRRSMYKSIKYILPAFLIAIVLLVPQISDMVSGQGFERGKSLVFFQGGMPALGQNIISFLNLNFWVFGRDSIGLRHAVPGYGVLFKTILTLLVIGLVKIIKSKTNVFYIAWLLLGLLPSILSTDAPHAIRSLMALPPVILVSTMAYMSIKPRSIRAVIIALLFVELGFYQYVYYKSYAALSANAFQFGYMQAIESAEKYGRTADKFIMTTKYGQPYVYTLLYRKITPEEFKFGALANYEFHEIKWPNYQKNYLYIATPEEIPVTDPHVVDTVKIPHTEEVVFVIAKT